MPPLLLLTRPEGQSRAFAARLADVPHEALIAPVSCIVPLEWDRRLADGVRGVILTSANAVAAVAHLAPLPAWCVGGATARAAARAGFAARASGGDAVALIVELAAEGPEGPVLHAHGAHLARDLVAALGGRGPQIRSAAVYEARLLPWPDDVRDRLAQAAAEGRRIVAPAFSPRAAAELSARLGTWPEAVHIVAISPAAAARLAPALAQTATTAPHPEGMEAAVRAALAAGI